MATLNRADSRVNPTPLRHISPIFVHFELIKQFTYGLTLFWFPNKWQNLPNNSHRATDLGPHLRIQNDVNFLFLFRSDHLTKFQRSSGPTKNNPYPCEITFSLFRPPFQQPATCRPSPLGNRQRILNQHRLASGYGRALTVSYKIHV